MAGIPRVGGVVVVSLVVAAALLLVAVPQHARAASSSATATTTPSSTTQATLCHVDEGALARIYPIVHNCTHLEAGQTCVSHCDESRQFSGEPLRIKCTSSGVTDPPFPQMQCTRRRHHIQTTEDGIVITAYQGDVIARVGETTVGVLELDADVSTIHTRLSEIEAQDLNPRVEDLEQGFPLLSSELSAVNASQSAQVAASVSSLRADLSDAVNDAMQSRQDLDTELRTRITAAENTARTNIENATALLSQQVAAASLSLESELQDLNTAFSEVVDNALESVGSVESRVDSHDTTLSAQTADISTTSMELSAVAERVDTAEEDIDLVQGLLGVGHRLGGSADNPGRTCGHILLSQGGSNVYGDGMYWIDPNGGTVADAFQAFCDMANGGWTVIQPAGSVALGRHRDFDNTDQQNWFTDPIYGGAPFAYDISDSQLTALIEHSTSAKQQVTFYCKGVLIWNHQNAYAETHAAKFRSFVSNDNVWQGPPGADGAVPNVLSDGCEGNANAVTETTVFELITDSPDYLPVVDIRINDDGNDGEEWGVEYGAVSFQFALRDGTTKPRAGKSCSHILRDFPASPSGTYFIDPNGQRNDDAFQVFCDMANGGWTQINPGGSVPAGDHYDGSDTRIWLSALGISMPWSISDSQLTALQSISSHASQRLFFLCKGVIAWRYDSISTALKLSGAAIWFRSTADSTGIVWTPEDVPGASTYNPSPVVFSDACSMNDGTWRQTEFIFATSNARALPIRDLAAEDHGNDGEEYGANPEPVMFRTDFTVTKLGSTPLNPGRTCADILFASGGSAPDGWYWLDPNGGSPANAVFLECDMLNGGWTGVRPKQRTIPIKQWLGTSGDSPTWFSDTSSGFRMPYNIDSSQLGALQSLSIEGKQSILFLCNGVLAWHSGSSLDGTNALQFRGGVTSDTTWLYNSAETSRPQVNYELDGCRHNDRLASTPFEFHTTLTKALPINDMRVRDAGNSGEVFGAEMGVTWFR